MSPDPNFKPQHWKKRDARRPASDRYRFVVAAARHVVLSPHGVAMLLRRRAMSCGEAALRLVTVRAKRADRGVAKSLEGRSPLTGHNHIHRFFFSRPDFLSCSATAKYSVFGKSESHQCVVGPLRKTVVAARVLFFRGSNLSIGAARRVAGKLSFTKAKKNGRD
jgi:hypothetical protein